MTAEEDLTAELERLEGERDELAFHHGRALQQIADAWRALATIPGYPHVRTAAGPDGAASLAVNIEQVGRDLAEAKATVRRVDAIDLTCTNYFRGNCPESGRDIESTYSADGYCLSCRVRAALDRP